MLLHPPRINLPRGAAPCLPTSLNLLSFSSKLSLPVSISFLLSQCQSASFSLSINQLPFLLASKPPPPPSSLTLLFLSFVKQAATTSIVDPRSRGSSDIDHRSSSRCGQSPSSLTILRRLPRRMT